MRDRIPDAARDTERMRLAHIAFEALLALFTCVGLMIPLRAAFAPATQLGAALVCCAAAVLFVALGAVSRKVSVIRFLVAAALAALCVLTGRLPVAQFTEIGKAIVIAIQGNYAAVQMYAPQLMLVGTALCSLYISWGTWGSMTAYPIVVTTCAALLMCVLSGASLSVWMFAPMLTAMCVHVARSHQMEVGMGTALPVAALVVVLACLLAPAEGTVSKPFETFAQRVRNVVMDYLFFNDPRTVYTIQVEGFQPMGTTQLGGPVNPSPRDVMTVSVTRPVLLRGVLKDQYTGTAWMDTLSGRRYLYVDPRWNGARANLLDMERPPAAQRASALFTPLTVTVTMAVESASTLFMPQRPQSLQTGLEMVPYFNDTGEVFITRMLAPGDTYTVQAPAFLGTDAGLAPLLEAAAQGTDENEVLVRQRYLQMPGTVDDRVGQLVLQITADCATPLDRALAIQRYLAENYAYTLTPSSQAAGKDFVSYFLLEEKQGYCTYFASAMAVMGRLAGLPTRYVEGYAAIPDAGGTAYVTGRHAHAWTEIYFKGFGWVAFDPTPSTQNGPDQGGGNEDDDDQNPDNEPSPSPSPSPTPEPQDNPEHFDNPDDVPPEADVDASPTPTPTPAPDVPPPDHEPPNPPNLRWLWHVLWVLALVTALAARIWTSSPAYRARHVKDAHAALLLWYAASLQALGACRQPRESGETILQHAARVQQARAYKPSFLGLSRTVGMCVYGGMMPSASAVNAAQACYAAVFGALTWRQKCAVIWQWLLHGARAWDDTYTGRLTRWIARAKCWLEVWRTRLLQQARAHLSRLGKKRGGSTRKR